MSDSETETRSHTKLPGPEVLEKGLRDTVANIYRLGKLDELTVKRVRSATEEKLGLGPGFFKGHGEWKARSDRIIKDEVEVQENPSPQPSPAPEKQQSRKRPSPQASKAASSVKRRKKSAPVESEESDTPSVVEEDKPKASNKKQTKKVPAKARSIKKKPARAETESEEENASLSNGDGEGTAPEEQKAVNKNVGDGEASESEMSVLIDEEEPKPKKKRAPKAPSTKGKATKDTSEKKRKETVPDDPDRDEIKRLQGWLVKCGIRKVWGRELMGCSTPKDKIRHLKAMLKDAGMDGRYSIEKANRIREDRELKADLEAVQEGAKKWGAPAAGEEEGSPKTGRSSRRIAKSFRQLDFLGEEDQDSESD